VELAVWDDVPVSVALFELLRVVVGVVEADAAMVGLGLPDPVSLLLAVEPHMSHGQRAGSRPWPARGCRGGSLAPFLVVSWPSAKPHAPLLIAVTLHHHHHFLSSVLSVNRHGGRGRARRY
jgi:hypothetical protein